MTFESHTENIPDKTPENRSTESLSTTEMTVVKNEIQVALMKDFGIVSGDIDSALAWVNQYAKDFSDYLYEHAQLALDWKNGHTNAVLEELIQAEKDGFPHRDTH